METVEALEVAKKKGWLNTGVIWYACSSPLTNIPVTIEAKRGLIEKLINSELWSQWHCLIRAEPRDILAINFWDDVGTLLWCLANPVFTCLEDDSLQLEVALSDSATPTNGTVFIRLGTIFLGDLSLTSTGDLVGTMTSFNETPYPIENIHDAPEAPC